MTQALLGPHAVSRETLARLKTYEALLRKWNPVINLVSRATLDDVWDRHFLDSAQLIDLAGRAWKTWADLGSGGGFPGLVVAILSAEQRPDARIILVESDRRKAAFLQTVAHETGLTPQVIADRAETVPPLSADVVSARALAPLGKLLPYAERHLSATGTALFPKGANHQAELHQALETWRFSYEATASVTDSAAVVYAIKGIARA